MQPTRLKAATWFNLWIGSRDVLGEVIEDGLPTLTLLFQRMLGFGFESYTYRHTLCAIDEFDRPVSVSKHILNALVRNDLCVRAFKIEAKAAIFGFHARGKPTPHAQINS